MYINFNFKLLKLNIMNALKFKKSYIQLMSLLIVGSGFLIGVGAGNVHACPSEISKENEKKTYRQLQRQVRNYIAYPEEALERKINGDVEVVFSVSEEGVIEVVKVKGEDDFLKKTAYKQLNDQEVYTKECIHGKLFSVKIKYDVQET